MGSEDTRIRAVLFRLIAPERRRLAAALALSVAACGVELIPYILLAESAATFLAGPLPAGHFLRLAAQIAAALFLKHALYGAAYYFSHVAAFRLLADIRRDLVRRLASAPLIRLQQDGSGGLRKVVLQDVERLEQFIAHHTVECMAAAAGPLIVVTVLAGMDWSLALAATAPACAGAVLQARATRGLGAVVERFSRLMGELNGAMVEYVRNVPVMRVFRQDARSFARLRRLLDRRLALVAAVTRRTVPGWSAFTVTMGMGAALLWPLALRLHARGDVTLAETIAAVLLGGGMLRPLLKVTRFGSEIREIAAGIRRIAPLLDIPIIAPVPTVPACGTAPDVVFDRVSFAHQDRPVLREVSFALPAGSLTALVGPSGAGKSTIVHLLGGLYRPDLGEITIGGRPLPGLSDGERCGLMTVAGQDAFLFQGTLLDNLRLGRPDADEAAVHRALRIAQAGTILRSRPEGWATPVGEGGYRLSGGECQRIALARAVLCDTPVLVLDEATAFADALTERRFIDALRDDLAGRTRLVVTHRLTAVEAADRILLLDDGRLVDEGHHSELMARCGLYRSLWRRQFDDDQWNDAHVLCS